MAFTVTATEGGSTAGGIALAVRVYTGQAASQPGTIASATQTAASLAITPAQTGSLVLGSLLGISGTYTVNGATTNIQDAHNIGGLEMCSFVASATSTAATPETLGYTTTGANSISVCLCEIEQAGTLALDGSTPAAVNSAGVTTITTASFTPPNGSILVALAQSNGGGSVTTMAITDTSGLGLTWTQQAHQAGAGNGYSGIFTAAIPGGSAPAGTVQQPATFPTPRRRPSRAVVNFTPVVTVNTGHGPAGTVQPLAASLIAPRRKPSRAVVRFIPVTTTNHPAPPPRPQHGTPSSDEARGFKRWLLWGP